MAGRHHATWAPPRERSSQQWAQHSVDTDPLRYGKRNARRDTSVCWGKHFTYYVATLSPTGFSEGAGLSADRRLSCTLYVQDRVVGYLDDPARAMGWVNAANHKMGRDYASFKYDAS